MIFCSNKMISSYTKYDIFFFLKGRVFSFFCLFLPFYNNHKTLSLSLEAVALKHPLLSHNHKHNAKLHAFFGYLFLFHIKLLVFQTFCFLCLFSLALFLLLIFHLYHFLSRTEHLIHLSQLVLVNLNGMGGLELNLRLVSIQSREKPLYHPDNCF